jgi:hypothetical protein
MRYVGIALVSIIAGIGGGLLAYSLAQPSIEQVAQMLAVTDGVADRHLVQEIRRNAGERAELMGFGVGFLSCGATAVLMSFLTTIVDYNVRLRQNEVARSSAGP